jgi:hypothetical protein
MFSWMTSPLPLSAPARFALIMDGLKKALAEKIADYPWTGPMVVYVWNRLSRINTIFQALAVLIAEGTLPRERVCRPRVAMVQSPMRALPDPEAPKPVWRLFSYRRAWLVAAMPSLARRFGAAQFGSQLQYLLTDPEMMALVAASPRMRRTLRPLLWMLGIEASLIRLPPLPPPSPVVVVQETTDAGVVDAVLVCPSYPPCGEVLALVPEGQGREPEFFGRV